MPHSPDRTKVFISYSHADRKWLKRLQVHLQPLSRAGLVQWWDDTKITPGFNWQGEIEAALSTAKVAVLLISADFYGSPYIATYEVPALLRAAEQDGATLLPVIVSASRFTQDPQLRHIQAINPSLKPLVDMSRGERERLWDGLAARIASLFPNQAHSDAAAVGPTGSEVDGGGPAGTSTDRRLLLDAVPAVGLFLDRVEYLQSIESFIDDRNRTLYILQGFSGIGKTMLAARIAGVCTSRFDGVFWVKCTGAQSSADLLFSKLSTFFEEQGDSSLRGFWSDARPGSLEMKINRLIRALNARRCFLVFDEFEQWLGADLQLTNADVKRVMAAILRAAHRSKVMLVSTRRPFFDPVVDPLPVGVSVEQTLVGLGQEDAMTLLHELGVVGRDEKLLQRIIAHCDNGNPYMLQIFGYLVGRHHRDPEELLESGETTRGLKDLLTNAVQTLPDVSRAELERLCIHRLPIAREEFRALGMRFDTVIGSLLDHFLAIELGDANVVGVTAVVRRFILESIPEQRRGERHRGAAAFYAAARSARVPRHYADLQLALEEGFHRREAGDGDGAARAVLSVMPMMVAWGFVDHAEQYTTMALEGTQDDLLQAEGQWMLGNIRDLRTDYRAALDFFSGSLKLSEAHDDWAGMCRSLSRIGRIHNALHDFDRANVYFDRCIRLCDEHDVSAGWAGSLLGKAWNLQETSDDPEPALELFAQSIARAEISADYETLCTAHRQIGFLMSATAQKRGDAFGHYAEALQIATERNLVKEIAAVHSELCYLRTESGDVEKAGEHCERAIDMYRSLGDAYGLASAYLQSRQMARSGWCLGSGDRLVRAVPKDVRRDWRWRGAGVRATVPGETVRSARADRQGGRVIVDGSPLGRRSQPHADARRGGGTASTAARTSAQRLTQLLGSGPGGLDR